MIDFRFWIPRIIAGAITIWMIAEGIAAVSFLKAAIAGAAI